MAASLGGRMSNSFLRNASHSNSYISPAHFLFSRGFSSKLFVKGISFATTEKSLTEAFSPFGKVVHVHILRNATTNKSKGFGYVTFEGEEEAQNALTNMNGKMVDQRVIFVDKAGRYTRGV
ncbi:hypothetical protein ACFX13_030677 [Malus domestica]|uniref:small RNA-binding protein 11, chloroplastic-like isoform X1 n=1 Tax=Malus domestica TaxID=3750 RepID=UPI000498AB48|nr:small RNA-binding protein 11, chloroplastic-like isoform X1 [Malus domestica]